jgi:DNA ligase-1
MESFNKVSDSTIDKFEVALAYNLDKVNNVDPIDGTYFASRKLDGVRCIAFVNTTSNEVEFYSRQGKLFTSLEKLKSPLLKLLKEYNECVMVFDGELCVVDKDGNEDFSAAVQRVTKKDVIAEDIRYCIFDIMPVDVFYNGGGKVFNDRYNEYISLYLKNVNINADVNKYIGVLSQELIDSQERFDYWTNAVKENGWEGFMLRKNVPYKSGRTKDLIKVKKFQDAEYVVKDVTFGKAHYNEGGMVERDIVAGLIIEHKGNDVQVGSGLSKEQRISWFNDPSQIIGKTITVQYFSESTNKKDNKISLRFPVLKHVYEDGRTI